MATITREVPAHAPTMASVEAKIIRCGCTDARKRAPNWHGSLGQPCPNPRATEDQGVVSFWHRNPLYRLRYWFLRNFRRWRAIKFDEVAK
jgi:hypothetical protein